jgi:formate hydrogenlyase subunit 3/multisubunit Na+/H+ antiporter MnhD subunit
MAKAQFLLIFISILPFLGGIINAIKKTAGSKLISNATLILSAIFLTSAVILLINYPTGGSFDLFKMSREISIGLIIEPISLVFLILIALIWISYFLV